MVGTKVEAVGSSRQEKKEKCKNVVVFQMDELFCNSPLLPYRTLPPTPLFLFKIITNIPQHTPVPNPIVSSQLSFPSYLKNSNKRNVTTIYIVTPPFLSYKVLLPCITHHHQIRHRHHT
jgi:hypothetical protein